MYILGIHDNHDASAALMKDGEIIAAAQEERFSGLKGDYGFPRMAVDFCLKHAGIRPCDIDRIALSGANSNPVLTFLKRNVNFSVSDWVKEQDEFWRPRKLQGRDANYLDIFRGRDFKTDSYYDYSGLLSGYMKEDEMKEFLRRRLKFISGYLGVSEEKITVSNHEANHKAYALFSSFLRSQDVLILTCEGMGDDYNATVSAYENGNIRTIKEMRENVLGNIYQYVTLMLGMKPDQHEYKVMGLAPYANEYETAKAYKVFRKVLKVDGMEVKFDRRPADLYFTLREELKDCRFDGIAAGVQKFLEEVLCQWVRNCVSQTGIRKVVIGGGVAQNIKAIKAVSELDCVDDVFVPPAAGDTSNSVGACYNLAYQLSDKTYAAHENIRPLENIYLGPGIDAEEIGSCLDSLACAGDFVVRRGIGNKEIAALLKEGRIVALMRGRMEFGLRALGNRSILADPSNPLTIDRINRKIKFRDFWMPFTPSILDKCAGEYIVNPKNLLCPYMAMAFDSRQENRYAFPAAMHPADKTVRPQILKESRNMAYYGLISEFKKLSGLGLVLNTSLNLHGKPVALGPKEGMDIFLRSKLDALVMEDCLILREKE